MDLKNLTPQRKDEQDNWIHSEAKHPVVTVTWDEDIPWTPGGLPPARLLIRHNLMQKTEGVRRWEVKLAAPNVEGDTMFAVMLVSFDYDVPPSQRDFVEKDHPVTLQDVRELTRLALRWYVLRYPDLHFWGEVASEITPYVDTMKTT